MAPQAIPRRFYALDTLRGLAALSVVLWHWQHFFQPLNSRGEAFHATQQPLHRLLFLFYTQGDAAVQLFFSLSGFIFFWLYAAHIRQGQVSPREFAVLRLSRLYPLHLATLVFVALGQMAMVRLTGQSFVYPFNDGYHLLLNLLFASAWGLEKGFSYNAPIWSVSVEVLLYALFFVHARWLGKNALALAAMVALGGWLYRFNPGIASGVQGFFVGGLVLLAYEHIIATGDRWQLRRWLPWLALAAWLAALWGASQGRDYYNAQPGWLLRQIGANWALAVLFPLTILSLALLETWRGSLGRRLAWVGDLSYSSYLLHFPLQLAAAGLTAWLAVGQEVFYRPGFLLAFFALLVAVSLASYHGFERPLQAWLRQRFLRLRRQQPAQGQVDGGAG